MWGFALFPQTVRTGFKEPILEYIINYETHYNCWRGSKVLKVRYSKPAKQSNTFWELVYRFSFGICVDYSAIGIFQPRFLAKKRIPLSQKWSLIIVIFFDRKLTTTHREVEWAWSRRRVTSPRLISLSRGRWRLTPANTLAALPTPTPRQSSCTCWTVRPKWLFVVEGMGLLRRIRGRRWLE